MPEPLLYYLIGNTVFIATCRKRMPQAMYGIRYIRILVGQPPPSVLHGVAVPLHRTIRRVPLPGGNELRIQQS